MGCERGRDHTRTSGDIWDVKEVGTILVLQVTYVCERVGTILALQVTYGM